MILDFNPPSYHIMQAAPLDHRYFLLAGVLHRKRNDSPIIFMIYAWEIKAPVKSVTLDALVECYQAHVLAVTTSHGTAPPF